MISKEKIRTAFEPLQVRLAGATLIIWSTGGARLPDAEFADLLVRARPPSPGS